METRLYLYICFGPSTRELALTLTLNLHLLTPPLCLVHPYQCCSHHHNQMDSLPTPPNEEHGRPQGQKRSHTVSKPLKTVHRTLKRTSTHGHPASPARDTHSQHGDGRHKRVWKACERCRMKKTKVGNPLENNFLLWRIPSTDTPRSAMGSFPARGARTTA